MHTMRYDAVDYCDFVSCFRKMLCIGQGTGGLSARLLVSKKYTYRGAAFRSGTFWLAEGLLLVVFCWVGGWFERCDILLRTKHWTVLQVHFDYVLRQGTVIGLLGAHTCCVLTKLFSSVYSENGGVISERN